jgi:hypothetical protein
MAWRLAVRFDFTAARATIEAHSNFSAGFGPNMAHGTDDNVGWWLLLTLAIQLPIPQCPNRAIPGCALPTAALRRATAGGDN